MEFSGHFYSDGTCECPFLGKCFECGKECTDHDLVADVYWCEDCMSSNFLKYGLGLEK